MSATLQYELVDLLLLLVLGTAVYTDIRRHRIPNWLSLGALVTGLLLSHLLFPDSRILDSLKGAGVGLAALLPFYLMGGMGAGDVKLMAAIGSFTGPETAFLAVCFSLMAGGCIALLMILRSGELAMLYRRYLVMISARTLIPAEEGSIAKRRFPYALSIAIGALIALGLEGRLDFIPIGTWVSQLQLAGGFQ
jgi:prepilin peptidase CpaA